MGEPSLSAGNQYFQTQSVISSVKFNCIGHASFHHEMLWTWDDYASCPDFVYSAGTNIPFLDGERNIIEEIYFFHGDIPIICVVLMFENRDRCPDDALNFPAVLVHDTKWIVKKNKENLRWSNRTLLM